MLYKFGPPEGSIHHLSRRLPQKYCQVGPSDRSLQGPSKPLPGCSQQEVAQPGDPRDSSEAPRKLPSSASDARNLLWSMTLLSVDLQRNYYIKNVGLFEENSILPLPESLEASGVESVWVCCMCAHATACLFAVSRQSKSCEMWGCLEATSPYMVSAHFHPWYQRK